MNPVLIDAPPAKALIWRGEPSIAVVSSPRTKTPWWLWPHLFSLDAPLVALVWQRWWARAADTQLPPSREIVLGLGVWLIYLVDRLADTTGKDRHEHRTARHLFSGARRQLLRPLVMLIAVVLMVATPRWLTGTEFRAGMVLLAFAVGYFWLIHCWPGRGWAAFLPKEAVVGGMFAAGSTFFVVCRSSAFSLAIWLCLALFAAVCFLNCALITKWERNTWDQRERSSLLNSFPRLTAHLGLACAIVAAIALAFAGATERVLTIPVAISALSLAGLDRCAHRLSVDALRVAADLVLLTPLIALVFSLATL